MKPNPVLRRLILKGYVTSLLILCCSFIQAQSLISINPNSALQTQYVSTLVTGSGLQFTQASGPTSWGNFYMTGFSNIIYPNYVTIVDDDHFYATWTIPANAPPGNYTVRFEYPDPSNPFPGIINYDVPGGFNIGACSPTPVSVIATGPNTVCYPGTVSLAASPTAGLSFQWYNGNLMLNGATGSSYTATTSGSYRCIAVNAAGCVATSNNVSVTVNYPPNPSISVFTSTTICNGSNVILYAPLAVNMNYQWSLNGVSITGAVNHTYSATNAGAYRVTMTNLSNGCSATSGPTTITVLPLPPAVITPSGPTSFCSGTGVTLSANTGAGFGYQWYKFGNPIAGATAPTLVVNNSAKYKVQVIDSYGCSRKSASVTTTSWPLPAASITASGSTTFCAGDSVVLSANTGAGLTYQWKKYTNFIAGANASNYSAKTTGNYKAVVTNSYGCSKTSNSIAVNVPCRLPGTESTPGSVVISELSGLQMVQIDGALEGVVRIVNMQGQLVYQQSAYDAMQIDLAGLPAGIYIIHVQTSDQLVTRRMYLGDR